jgi:hypothetical protein
VVVGVEHAELDDLAEVGAAPDRVRLPPRRRQRWQQDADQHRDDADDDEQLDQGEGAATRSIASTWRDDASGRIYVSSNHLSHAPARLDRFRAKSDMTPGFYDPPIGAAIETWPPDQR